jgi:DNA-binding transcriptional MerR regulator
MALTIGQASQATGLSADTLRYYERIGLLGAIGRNTGGQRRYRDADIARLRFVKRAQSMDFSLDEIAQLLALRDRRGDVRADVRALTETKLAAIEVRIEALSRLRDELGTLINECRASEHECPIIGRIDEPDAAGRSTDGGRR